MRDYKTAVFIGRFQPFHNEHLHVLREALKVADHVIILVGSHNTAPNIKNPFSVMQRRDMINACLNDEEKYRTTVCPLRDYHYSDSLWVANVQQIVSSLAGPGPIALFGAYKDASSYYLNMFPQWEFVAVKQKAFLDSTDIRNAWYKRTDPRPIMDFNHYHPDVCFKAMEDMSWVKHLPEQVDDWLQKNYFSTDQYTAHVQEFRHYQDYKAKWGGGPFVTVDAVVTCSGHVLVVKRKFLPGKNLWALPGGFLKLSERIEDGAIRELVEETNIQIPKPSLKNAIVDSKVFDYPNRSLRGRTITHVFHVKLFEGALPIVTGADDAAKARWMSICDVYANEDKFFEDHFHIISHFITRG
jgi:bifunctional NMN adenylyltransferase/nudix hydrolase